MKTVFDVRRALTAAYDADPPKPKKGSTFIIKADIDFRSSGGPLIEKGTKGKVLIVRRDSDECWVEIDGIGRRRLHNQYIV